MLVLVLLGGTVGMAAPPPPGFALPPPTVCAVSVVLSADAPPFVSLECSGPGTPVAVVVGANVSAFAAAFTGVRLLSASPAGTTGTAEGGTGANGTSETAWAAEVPVAEWGVALLNITHLRLVDSRIDGAPLSPSGPLLSCVRCPFVSTSNLTFDSLRGRDSVTDGSIRLDLLEPPVYGAALFDGLAAANLEDVTCNLVRQAAGWACLLMRWLGSAAASDLYGIKYSVDEQSSQVQPPWLLIRRGRFSQNMRGDDGMPNLGLGAIVLAHSDIRSSSQQGTNTAPQALYATLPVDIVDSEFTYNYGGSGGALAVLPGVTLGFFTLWSSRFERNRAVLSGGAIWHGRTNIGVPMNNLSLEAGSMLYCNTAGMHGSKLDNNTAVAGNGGAVAVMDQGGRGGGSGSRTTLTWVHADSGGSISDNAANVDLQYGTYGRGGAIYVDGSMTGSVVLASARAEGNSAAAEGGFLFSTDNIGLMMINLRDPDADGIHLLDGASLSHNTAVRDGGAIAAVGLISRITGNAASLYRGGAIWAQGKPPPYIRPYDPSLMESGLWIGVRSVTSSGDPSPSNGYAAAPPPPYALKQPEIFWFIALSNGYLKEAHIENCVLESNRASRGGVLYAFGGVGSLHVTHSSMRLNVAGTEGGVLATDGDVGHLVHEAAWVYNNTALLSGGAFSVGGSITSALVLSGSFAENNTARQNGGFLAVAGSVRSLSVSADSAVSGNTARRGDGGGIWIGGDAPYIRVTGTLCNFSGNTAGGEGGAIWVGGRVQLLSVSGGAAVQGNSAGMSGGFLLAGRGIDTVDVSQGARVHNNSARLTGGAISSSSDVGIVQLTAGGLMEFNRAGGSGGAAHVNGQLMRLEVSGGSRLDGNGAGGSGGAVWARSAAGAWVVRRNASISGNGGGLDGGGLALHDCTAADAAASLGEEPFSLTLSGAARAVGNTAGRDGGLLFAGSGGAVGGASGCCFMGSLRLAGSSLVANNTADGSGGVLRTEGVALLTVTSGSSMYGNRARTGGGGAIHVVQLGSAYLSNGSLIRANRAWAGAGGAIWAGGLGLLAVGGGSQLSDNVAGTSGGALWTRSLSSLVVSGGSRVVGNTAADSGGAVWAASLAPPPQLPPADFEPPAAPPALPPPPPALSLAAVRRALLQLPDLVIRLTNTNITLNQAPLGSGGGIYVNTTGCSLAVRGGDLSRNMAGIGGGAAAVVCPRPGDGLVALLLALLRAGRPAAEGDGGGEEAAQALLSAANLTERQMQAAAAAMAYLQPRTAITSGARLTANVARRGRGGALLIDLSRSAAVLLAPPAAAAAFAAIAAASGGGTPLASADAATAAGRSTAAAALPLLALDDVILYGNRASIGGGAVAIAGGAGFDILTSGSDDDLLPEVSDTSGSEGSGQSGVAAAVVAMTSVLAVAAAVATANGTVVMCNTVFEGNAVTADAGPVAAAATKGLCGGGAVQLAGPFAVANLLSVTLRNNSAAAGLASPVPACGGGALHIGPKSSAALRASLVTGNVAAADGGGILCRNCSSLYVYGGSVSYCRSVCGAGGGVALTEASRAALVTADLGHNTAASGGSVSAWAEPPQAASSSSALSGDALASAALNRSAVSVAPRQGTWLLLDRCRLHDSRAAMPACELQTPLTPVQRYKGQGGGLLVGGQVAAALVQCDLSAGNDAAAPAGGAALAVALSCNATGGSEEAARALEAARAVLSEPQGLARELGALGAPLLAYRPRTLARLGALTSAATAPGGGACWPLALSDVALLSGNAVQGLAGTPGADNRTAAQQEALGRGLTDCLLQQLSARAAVERPLTDGGGPSARGGTTLPAYSQALTQMLMYLPPARLRLVGLSVLPAVATAAATAGSAGLKRTATTVVSADDAKLIAEGEGGAASTGLAAELLGTAAGGPSPTAVERLWIPLGDNLRLAVQLVNGAGQAVTEHSPLEVVISVEPTSRTQLLSSKPPAQGAESGAVQWEDLAIRGWPGPVTLRFSASSPGGYTGRLCAACTPGHYIDSDFQCNPCPSVSQTVGLGLLAVLFSMIVVLYTTFATYTESRAQGQTKEDVRAESVSEIITVIVVHLQYFIIVTRLNMNWPRIITNMQGALAMVTGAETYVAFSPACLYPESASDQQAAAQMLGALILPLTVVALSCLLWAIRYYVSNTAMLRRGSLGIPKRALRRLQWRGPVTGSGGKRSRRARLAAQILDNVTACEDEEEDLPPGLSSLAEGGDAQQLGDDGLVEVRGRALAKAVPSAFALAPRAPSSDGTVSPRSVSWEATPEGTPRRAAVHPEPAPQVRAAAGATGQPIAEATEQPTGGNGAATSGGGSTRAAGEAGRIASSSPPEVEEWTHVASVGVVLAEEGSPRDKDREKEPRPSNGLRHRTSMVLAKARAVASAAVKPVSAPLQVTPSSALVHVDTAVSLPAQLLMVTLIAMFVLYPALAQVSLSVFSCYLIDDGQGKLGSFERATWPWGYWVRDMNQQCYSATHAAVWVPVGVVAVCVFCLGPPLASLVITFRRRRTLYEYHTVQTWGFLYKRYRPQYYWWASIQELQTLTLVIVDVFGRALPVVQQALLLLVGFTAISLVSMACAPLRSRLLVVCEFLSLGVLSLTITLGLFSIDRQISDESDDTVLGVCILVANCLLILFYAFALVRQGSERLRGMLRSAPVAACAARLRVAARRGCGARAGAWGCWALCEPERESGDEWCEEEDGATREEQGGSANLSDVDEGAEVDMEGQEDVTSHSRAS
ncbi:hypothetical protein HYH03_011731 [Edaphochlamys debaryana]|uniref:Uncharacterized protein n=1 Tax=Edaphochlamys debaryana TaxID=47281 RepID=A0A835XTE7_9CHLO|nr:hypothetical protein HYH03_011731 [Edaphochlamys debaryana]|eukprot:KAG2489781.1 hypothetical protein HYH03_011731 [Edaphochlamys debaryana]